MTSLPLVGRSASTDPLALQGTASTVASCTSARLTRSTVRPPSSERTHHSSSSRSTSGSAARSPRPAGSDLDLGIPVLVDDVDDAAARAYGGWPDRLVVVVPGGRVVFQSPRASRLRRRGGGSRPPSSASCCPRSERRRAAAPEFGSAPAGEPSDLVPLAAGPVAPRRSTDCSRAASQRCPSQGDGPRRRSRRGD